MRPLLDGIRADGHFACHQLRQVIRIKLIIILLRIFLRQQERFGRTAVCLDTANIRQRVQAIVAAAAENGYICCGYDNLGHGKTARSDDELGFIAPRNGWKYLVNDVEAFEKAVKKMYPDKPLYLMGHSMGSFIARLAAESYPETAGKLIICGTGGPKQAASVFGLLLTDILGLIKGKKHRSGFINSVAFGSYNRRFEPLSKYEWITSDREITAKYAQDKYCNFIFTVSAMHDLVKLNFLANRRRWFVNLKKSLPVLIISGTDDPVGNYGKGVKAVYRKLKASGQKGVTLKLYEGCRHEIHNDTCKNEVISDIFAFLNS